MHIHIVATLSIAGFTWITHQFPQKNEKPPTKADGFTYKEKHYKES